MTKISSKVSAVVAASLLSTFSLMSTSVAQAAPPTASAIVMPLQGTFRACDFTELSYVGPRGSAQLVARVASVGSGTVVASIDVAAAEPDARYDVRVIQMPRPSIGCAPGAPGVLSGALQTNDVGAGNILVQGPRQSGANGVWVFVERAGEYSQTPAEYYTTTFVASI